MGAAGGSGRSSEGPRAHASSLNSAKKEHPRKKKKKGKLPVSHGRTMGLGVRCGRGLTPCGVGGVPVLLGHSSPGTRSRLTCPPPPPPPQAAHSGQRQLWRRARLQAGLQRCFVNVKVTQGASCGASLPAEDAAAHPRAGWPPHGHACQCVRGGHSHPGFEEGAHWTISLSLNLCSQEKRVVKAALRLSVAGWCTLVEKQRSPGEGRGLHFHRCV